MYGGGGNSGAPYKNDFIELHNADGCRPISLTGKSVQYRSATGTTNPTGVIALSGSIAAHGHYLVVGASTAAVGAAAHR